MAFTNIKEFKAKCKAWYQDVQIKYLPNYQRVIAFEALKRIVKRTPKDKGRAAGNWQVTINFIPTSVLPDLDKDGGATIASGYSAMAKIPPFCVVWITNNLDYIDVLEYGKFKPRDPGPSKDKRAGRKGEILVKHGFSLQAPHGMVGITIEELRFAGSTRLYSG